MVSSNEIGKFVRKHTKATFQDLVAATGVSTGCGRCRPLAEEQFEVFMKKVVPEKQLSFNFKR